MTTDGLYLGEIQVRIARLNAAIEVRKLTVLVPQDLAKSIQDAVVGCGLDAQSMWDLRRYIATTAGRQDTSPTAVREHFKPEKED